MSVQPRTGQAELRNRRFHPALLTLYPQEGAFSREQCSHRLPVGSVLSLAMR